MKDNRDPQALGYRMLNIKEKTGLSLTEVYDQIICDSGTAYVSNEGPIEKYGDPREKHDGPA